MCRKNHTQATYKSSPFHGDVTITGCQVGQPVFVIHKADVCDKGSTIIDYPVWAYIRCTAGSNDARPATYHHYVVGTYHNGATDVSGGPNCFIVIANATSVTFNCNTSNGSTLIFYK